MVVYREMTGSGGMNSGPYRKHVKWGQCTYKNPIRAKQENMITCNHRKHVKMRSVYVQESDQGQTRNYDNL